jgi:calcineurin-like phosphoesterase family protein
MGQLADTIPLIDRLHGDKILVPGNHDPIWSGAPQKRKDRWRAEFTSRFLAIQPETYVGTIGETPGPVVPLTVSHFPFVATDERDFDQWRPVDKGRWLVHGHVHDHWRQRGRQINVGLDAWGGEPVPLETVASFIDMGEADIAAAPW